MSPRQNLLARSERQQPCDLCGENQFRIVDRFDRRRKPLVTVICERCGLVSHEQVPSDDELARYYQQQYRADYHGQLAPAPHRVLRAWEGGRWLYRQLCPYVSSRSKVCEIGAGIGCTVKVFELAGFDAEGIEPGVSFQQFGQRQLAARVGAGDLFEMPTVPAYDFVLLVHVIEHFNSPSRALRHTHRLLRPGGRLYVECPNLGAPHAAPGQQFHVAHIHNFTPPTLTMLAEHAGFEVVAWLTGPRDRALRVVLQRSEDVEPRFLPNSYSETLQALYRYSRLSYHLRPRYWLDRGYRDVRFISHHLWARQRLRRLLRRCQDNAANLADLATVPTRLESRPPRASATAPIH